MENKKIKNMQHHLLWCNPLLIRSTPALLVSPKRKNSTKALVTGISEEKTSNGSHTWCLSALKKGCPDSSSHSFLQVWIRYMVFFIQVIHVQLSPDIQYLSWIREMEEPKCKHASISCSLRSHTILQQTCAQFVQLEQIKAAFNLAKQQNNAKDQTTHKKQDGLDHVSKLVQ